MAWQGRHGEARFGEARLGKARPGREWQERVTWQPQTYSFFLILAIDWRRYGIRNGIDSARKTALPEQAWETISASLKIMHPSIVNDACAWSERTLYRERPGTTPLFDVPRINP